MDRIDNLNASADGNASASLDISDVPGDWTLRLRIEGPGLDKQALLYLEESTAEFFTNIRILTAVHLVGAGPVELTFRAYQFTSARVGHADARLRIHVPSITPGGNIKARLILSF